MADSNQTVLLGSMWMIRTPLDIMSHVTGVESPEALQVVEDIASAASPEEAAKVGRHNERFKPSLVRPDWSTAKLAVMHAGLTAKVHPLCLRWVPTLVEWLALQLLSSW